MARVLVVGAGISGLAAGRQAQSGGHEVTVLEAGERVGGSLLTAEVGGVTLDQGADAFLVRTPAARELVAELGAPLVHPAARRARVLVGGRLHPLPRTLLGIPLSLHASAGILGPRGTARATADLALPATDPPEEDTSVGALVRARLGDAVVQRLVAPLLGGVYAGDPDQISLRAAVPQLAGAAGGSLLRHAARVTPAASDAPVFGSLPTGLGSLPALVAAGLDVRQGTPVTGLRRTPTGWEAATPGGPVSADAVILATPAPVAARLLGDVAPHAAAAAAQTPYASVAIVTLVLPRAGAGLLADPGWSGWLVPPTEGRVAKGVTVSSAKWAHVGAADPELLLVRASVGRWGEEDDLRRSDTELAGVVAADVTSVAGARAPVLDSRVQRWDGALPQYLVGHLDRVAALRRALPAGLAVCGNGYDGVGVPACIRSGQAAADAVTGGLAARPVAAGH